MAKRRILDRDPLENILNGSTPDNQSSENRRSNKERPHSQSRNHSKENEETLVAFGTKVPADVLNDLRNAAYWSRKTIAELTTQALQREVRRMEEEQGQPFEQRPNELRPGRRMS